MSKHSKQIQSTMNKLIIRKANIEDASAIAQLHIRGWQTAYTHILPIEKLNALSLQEWEDEWTSRLQHPTAFIFVAEINSMLVGFIAFGSYRDEKNLDAKKAEIYAVYLDPEMKGKGYGAQLCQHACDMLQVQGFSHVLLWTFEDNTSAHRFYEAIGFQKTPTVKHIELLGVPVIEVQYGKPL